MNFKFVKERQYQRDSVRTVRLETLRAVEVLIHLALPTNQLSWPSARTSTPTRHVTRSYHQLQRPPTNRTTESEALSPHTEASQFLANTAAQIRPSLKSKESSISFRYSCPLVYPFLSSPPFQIHPPQYPPTPPSQPPFLLPYAQAAHPSASSPTPQKKVSA